ncbi:PREDICTED: uncharacterized protein LOC108507403 [Lepidothrix coronata]|uniref:Uncharacterized protein LOC108507403 n=1 Tax=Lepidothrix coronata TaxID=321398 RepID=A0A6J0IXY1_9PASS|nr:PREDICTED: uncharacterized protein LOC108507403 [Lepidothrix coronata]
MASAGRGGRVGGGARCGGGGSSRVSGRGADSGGRKGSGEGASRAEALPTSRPLCPEEEEAVAMAGAPRGDALAPRARAGGEGAPAAHTHGPLLPPGRTAQSQGSRRLIDASADQWRRPLKEVPWKGQRCQMYPDCESAVLEAERSSGTQLRTRCQGCRLSASPIARLPVYRTISSLGKFHKYVLHRLVGECCASLCGQLKGFFSWSAFMASVIHWASDRLACEKKLKPWVSETEQGWLKRHAVASKQKLPCDH